MLAYFASLRQPPLLLGVAPASAQLSRGTFGGLPRWADGGLVAAGLRRQFVHRIDPSVHAVGAGHPIGNGKDQLNWAGSSGTGATTCG